MSYVLWGLLALGVITAFGIVIGVCWANDMDSSLYRKYTKGDEYLDPFGSPCKGAKHGQ